jgi:hypothetical protein
MRAVPLDSSVFPVDDRYLSHRRRQHGYGETSSGIQQRLINFAKEQVPATI